MSIETKTTHRGRVYEVRLRRPDGREYARTFATLREAKGFEASERSTKNRGAWIDPAGSAIAFSDWAWRWLDLDVAKSPGARATDASIIRSALIPAFGSHTLGAIRPLDVHDLVAAWSRSAKPRTVRRRYATLSAMFHAAVELDLIGRSPCRGVKLPPVSPAPHRIIAPKELERLVAEIPERHRAMVYVGATLGLRIGETAGLRVRSVDFAHRTLTVSESVGEAAGRLFTKGPKTNAARRTIPLPEPLLAMLQSHVERFCSADPEDHLFTAPAGGPLRPNHFRARVWRPACQRAGLEGLGFHDLRRSSATVMVANGVSVRDAQQILGHADPRLLLAVYAQATDAGMRSATELAATHFMRPPEAIKKSRSRRPAPKQSNAGEQPRTTADAG